MVERWALSLLLLAPACSTTVPEPTGQESEETSMVWPAAPEQARIRFVRQFSDPGDLGMRESFTQRMRDFFAGSDDRGMKRPYSVATDGNRIVVADPGLGVVHVFNTSRKAYRKLDKAGKTPFASPIGVALGDNRLFVADSRLNKVFVLDKKLKPLFVLEGVQRPTGLAFDPDSHRLYVADTVAHEIKVFDRGGKLLFRIGERGSQDGQFNFPSHLSFAAGHLLVNDTMNFRIQVFDGDGKHLQSFGKHGTMAGYFSQPKGVALDSEGHIYVADAMTDVVQIFNMDGALLLSFGSNGARAGNFEMPTGIAIWGDMIYVTDSYNRRVQVFKYLREEN